MSKRVGKVIKTIGLDNQPELIEHCNKQKNFSSYVQILIEQDLARLQATQQHEQVIAKVELTRDEEIIFQYCRKYFREFGSMKYGELYPYFSLQPDSETLCCLFGDVRDLCEHMPTVVEYIKHIQEDLSDYAIFYDKLNHYWREKNPIPDSWQKEIIPGLTLLEALSKIIPEALDLKYHDLPITIKRISEVAGLTYQQTYTQLMPHIRPILKELHVEV